MSREVLKRLLGNYCEVQKMIENGNNWAVRTANNTKELGSKAQLVEEIIYEVKKMNKNKNNIRGDTRKKATNKKRKTRRN